MLMTMIPSNQELICAWGERYRLTDPSLRATRSQFADKYLRYTTQQTETFNLLFTLPSDLWTPSGQSRWQRHLLAPRTLSLWPLVEDHGENELPLVVWLNMTELGRVSCSPEHHRTQYPHQTGGYSTLPAMGSATASRVLLTSEPATTISSAWSLSWRQTPCNTLHKPPAEDLFGHGRWEAPTWGRQTWMVFSPF